MGRRIITVDVAEEEKGVEVIPRPRSLETHIGQEKLRSMLKVYIEAAKSRGGSPDRVLFYGPPGLGKAVLPGIIAHEMRVNMKITSGPAIEEPGEMAAILNDLQEGDVLFADEIRRLDRQMEEVLYPIMKDFTIDTMLERESLVCSIQPDLPKFTLMGATTKAGLLAAPLRDRFEVVQKLEFYTSEELKVIVPRSVQVLEVRVRNEGAMEIARRSKGAPRLANRLLKRIRNFAQVRYQGVITKEIADFALDVLDVDRLGLGNNDRSILLTMIQKFSGGPVGLDTLAAVLGKGVGMLERVYESYSLISGLVNRTPRGRVVTEYAYHHLGLSL